MISQKLHTGNGSLCGIIAATGMGEQRCLV
jgi:hypothetical protein